MFNSKTHIGIDISDSSLKGVVLATKGGHINLVAYKHWPLPPKIIEQGAIKNKEQLQKAMIDLVKALQKGKISEHVITIPLPEQKTYLTILPSPASDTNVQDYLQTEIPNHVPLTQDELAMDWQKINLPSTGDQLLVATTDTKTIAEYTQLFQNSLLLPQAFEIESVAIQRSLFPISSGDIKSAKLCCVVDLGENRSGISVGIAGIPLLSVSVPFAGKQITEIIAKELNLTVEQAQKAKHACGIEQTKASGAIQKILSAMLDDLVKRLQETKTFFATHSKLTQPWSTILIVGGGALLPGIEAYIKQQMQIPVIKANPLLNISNSSAIQKDESLSFATAIGLALRSTIEQGS